MLKEDCGEKGRYREKLFTSSSSYIKELNRVRSKMDVISFRKLLTLSVSFLESHLSKEENKEAVFCSSGDRARGPDGFPIAFLKNFWDLVEEDLQVFFNESHINGVIIGELGATFGS